MGFTLADRVGGRWPNRRVPFEVNREAFPDGSAARTAITNAINAWNATGVVTLSPRQGEVAFLLFGPQMAGLLTADPRTVALAGRCLFITGFAQVGFAASIVFGGALRGAGDTVAVMAINLASTIGLRLVAVLLVTLWLGYGLAAVWVVLSAELTVRGVLMYLRFAQGGWKHVKV